MIQESVAREVLAKATSTGGDFAEIFLEDRVNHSLRLRSGKIDAVSTGRLHGAGVRVFDGTRAHLCPHQRYQPGRPAPHGGNRRRGHSQRSRPGGDRRPCPAQRGPAGHHPPVARGRKGRPQGGKAAGGGRRRPAGLPGDCAGHGRLQRQRAERMDLQHRGRGRNGHRVYSRLGVQAIASNGTENQTGFEGPGASMGFELFDERVDPAVRPGKRRRLPTPCSTPPCAPPGTCPW